MEIVEFGICSAIPDPSSPAVSMANCPPTEVPTSFVGTQVGATGSCKLRMMNVDFGICSAIPDLISSADSSAAYGGKWNTPQPYIRALPMPCKMTGSDPTILIAKVLNDVLAMEIYASFKVKARQRTIVHNAECRCGVLTDPRSKKRGLELPSGGS